MYKTALVSSMERLHAVCLLCVLQAAAFDISQDLLNNFDWVNRLGAADLDHNQTTAPHLQQNVKNQCTSCMLPAKHSETTQHGLRS